MEQKKRGIKALIFDLGGVIIFYDHMIAARQMSKIIERDAKEIFKILNSNRGRFTCAYELGKPRRVYWDIAKKRLRVKKIPEKKFDELWTTMFWPNKKMISQIKKLRKNYRIALISNIGSLHLKYLEKKYSLNKLFPVRVYSYKVGVRKPKPKIFKTVLKRLKVKPKEAVFIDDRPENARGAEKLGMHGIYFKSNKQTFKELKRLGIK
jgi:putative hydrolase of the HAD superfamily